jgi:hypothetical protein
MLTRNVVSTLNGQSQYLQGGYPLAQATALFYQQFPTSDRPVEPRLNHCSLLEVRINVVVKAGEEGQGLAELHRAGRLRDEG